MRSVLLALAALCAAATPGGMTRAESDPPSGSFAVRCGTLHVGDGRVLSDAWLIVRDGRIRAVSEGGDAPASLPIVDASNRVVMPGLVAADTDLSGHPDAPYNETPDFIALDGFDFVREYRAALAGGVTTVYLAPGRNRLIPGQGSVVKLHGDDLVQRVLAETACLRLTLGRASTNAPSLFEPTIYPTADDPLLPARRQFPSSRLSQLARLRELFAHARTAEDGLHGEGAVENQYDPAPLRRAMLGELSLRIAAREAADIRRAIQFGRELNQNIVLEDPWQIERVASIAAGTGAAAVFRIPVLLSASNPGGEDRRQADAVRPTPESAAAAASAGIPVALAPARSQDLADFLMVAGVAVRHGLAPQAALAGVTSTAASILGVGDRVGSLEPGKDADFIILSGAPFEVGSMVEETWVDGARAFKRETESTLLAVKASRIMTLEGGTVQDGVIISDRGKIKGVGAELAIPYGARVIEIENGFIVPGFVDANSTLGLSGNGQGIPGGAANQRIADAIDHADPNFGPAAAAGVTTVLVSGRDGGVISGRVAAVKTGARSADDCIVADIAGVRFVFDGIGDNATAPLKAQLDRGKKYLDAWKKYEKALADFKAGKGEKPKEAKPEPTEAPAKDDPISGTWEMSFEVMPGRSLDITAVMQLEGKKVTGTMTISMGGRGGREQEFEGTFEGGKLEAALNFGGQSSKLTGTVANDSFTGTIASPMGEREVTGKRVAKSGEAPPPKASSPKKEADDGSPKKPNVDESLEPLKALLEKKATAVIRTTRAPAIRSVIAMFEKEGIPYALQGVGDAIDTPEILGNEAPAVILGPNVVRREKGEVVNAAARLSDAGADVAIVTGDTAGTRYLPLHAAHAVRWGMDPEAALRAITLTPAEMFGIADRVGSLKRGKDADFVVYDGSPFDMTSRVVLVVCNGRVVHDAREGAK